MERGRERVCVLQNVKKENDYLKLQTSLPPCPAAGAGNIRIALLSQATSISLFLSLALSLFLSLSLNRLYFPSPISHLLYAVFLSSLLHSSAPSFFSLALVQSLWMSAPLSVPRASRLRPRRRVCLRFPQSTSPSSRSASSCLSHPC